MDKLFHLYILESERDGTYYIGSTSNFADRITRHNEGRSNSQRTEYHGNWCIQKNLVVRLQLIIESLK